jgi:hypothetical protein
MERISSRLTFMFKWAFPLAWVGGFLFFFSDAITTGAVKQEPMLLLFAAVMFAVGILITKQLVWDLADSVYDHGSYLVVRRYGKEATIPLSNVMNVSSNTFTNPPRVTLRLIEPCELGANVSFSPKVPFLFIPFAKNAVAEGLIERTFRARSQLATEDRMGRHSP